MSLPGFQSSLAELVARGSLSEHSDIELSDLDSRRLKAIASQRGLPIMQTLYFSWRLTKVLSLLPLTSTLLGDEKLANILKAFWHENKATSLYFVDECISFLTFLDERVDNPPPYYEETTSFERARLKLRSDQSKGLDPIPQRVHFRCSPAALFDALNARSDVSELPKCDVVLQGVLEEDGSEKWSVVDVGKEGLL